MMFGILLKKQMTEIFRGYFYDAKKNKNYELADKLREQLINKNII